jgi:hypothetical protein
VTVRDTAAMIAGMAPVLRPGCFVFCCVPDADRAARLAPAALASFAEDEGASLLLPEARARAEGFDAALPMACITLTVASALDGVGLTAAVATALAAEGIPANVIAACHHDHVLVPAPLAERALAALAARARRV